LEYPELRYDKDKGLFTYQGSVDLPEPVAQWVAETVVNVKSSGEQVQHRFQRSGTAGHWITEDAFKQVTEITEGEVSVPSSPEGEITRNVEDTYSSWSILLADRVRTFIYLPLVFAYQNIDFIQKQVWQDAKDYLDQRNELEEWAYSYKSKESGKFVSFDDTSHSAVRAREMDKLYLLAELKIEGISKYFKSSYHGPVLGDCTGLNKACFDLAFEDLLLDMPKGTSSSKKMYWVWVDTRFRKHTEQWLSEEQRDRANYSMDIPERS